MGLRRGAYGPTAKVHPVSGRKFTTGQTRGARRGRGFLSRAATAPNPPTQLIVDQSPSFFPFSSLP
eukprot:5730174-Pyramimonas_sp.AAC.1